MHHAYLICNHRLGVGCGSSQRDGSGHQYRMQEAYAPKMIIRTEATDHRVTDPPRSDSGQGRMTIIVGINSSYSSDLTFFEVRRSLNVLTRPSSGGEAWFN